MKTQELLELAALDALGLLDEAEREQFDLAFRAASPALQAQIRREQTRIAGDDSLLPKVEPPMGLRARVLAAWREAMEAVSNRSPARRAGGAMTLLPSRGVSPLWRAGAIGCAAASIVLGFAVLNIKERINEITGLSQQMGVQEYFVKEFGPRFESVFTRPTTKHVQFDPSSSEVQAQAMLLIDEETNTGILYARQLPAAPGGYALVPLDERGQPVRDENGNIKKLCEIQPTGSQSGSALKDRFKINPGTPVGLIRTADAEATVILKGRQL